MLESVVRPLHEDYIDTMSSPYASTDEMDTDVEPDEHSYDVSDEESS